MSPGNETIFCEILPELCRIFEEKQFSDSLNIYLTNLRFHGELSGISDDVDLQIDGVRCSASFEKCQAVIQKKMSADDEAMFGIFGQECSPTTNLNTIPPEIACLNARLILPQASDQYISHIELYNYEIPSSAFHGIFSCNPEDIKLSQKLKNELYLHVNLKKEQQTSRSSIFESIFLMLEELGIIGERVTKISKLCVPFVHFGKVRISVKSQEKSGNVIVEIFNLFGSLFGSINFQEISDDVFLTVKALEASKKHLVFSEDSDEEVCTARPSRSMEILISILKDQMKLLSTSHEVETTPLPYLGIDSLRLAELEYHVASHPQFLELKLKAPFLIPYKTLAQIAEFLDGQEAHASEKALGSGTLGTGGLVEEPIRSSQEDAEEGKAHRISEKAHGTVETVGKPENPQDTREDDQELESEQEAEARTFSLKAGHSDETSKFKIPLSSQQKRILFVMELEKPYLSSNLLSQFAEPILLRLSNFHRVQGILNSLIMSHTILRTQYFEDYQYLLSGTETFLAILEKSSVSNPLSAIQCSKLSPETLQLIFHHISIDGRSLAIFYQQFKSSSTIELAPKLQYHDYCARAEESTSPEDLEYWKRYLELFSSEERLPASSICASYLYRTFPERIQNKFDGISREHSFSRFELFMGTLEFSLRRVLGQAFAMGFALDQRTFPFFDTIGCFTNVLPYFPRSSSTSFLESLKTCQKTLKDHRSHGSIPFEVIAKLSGEGDLFQIFVVSDVVDVVEDAKKRRVRFEDEACEVLQNPEELRRIAKYPMTWYLRQSDRLQIEVEYSEDLFKKDTIELILEDMFRIFNHFEGGREEPGLIRRSDFPRSTVSQIIGLSASSSPTLRVRYSSKDWKLNTRQLAGHILKGHIQKHGQLITEYPLVLKMPRTPALVEAVLAAWEAGLYPVPMHKDSKEAQIEKTLEALGIEEAFDSKDLCQTKLRIFNKSILYDLAYVTSTSGSTGTPKLVGTSFEGHSNLARQYTTTYQISSRDTVGQVVDPSFDIFFADIVKTLVNGARLLLARDSISTSEELLECTNVYLMPAFLSRIPCIESLNNLESLQYGGEPCAPHVLKQIFGAHQNLRVWQEFGLTEQTVYSARQRIYPRSLTSLDDLRRIGEPFDNIQLGVEGSQLVLSGVGLMRGYFGVTRQPLNKLNTGDEVSKRKQGGLIFMGRKDSQVKVRGHRIDLFEIECAALSSNLIDSCSCVVGENCQLVLFFKENENPDTQEKLKNHLEKELIAYKVPSRLVGLDSFPLTRTGKIDKKKLVELSNASQTSHVGSEVLERKAAISIARLSLTSSLKHWLEHYSNLEIPSDDDDIFTLGVDSIAVMLAMQKLRSENIEIPVGLFFKLKTIRKIVSGMVEPARDFKKIKLPNHFINLNHIQQRILFLSRMTSSDPFRLEFSIPVKNLENLTVGINTVMIGNQLLRSKLQRVQGEYQFLVLSATEAYLHASPSGASRPKDQFSIQLWMSSKNKLLTISIHHLICDGRSLQILEHQLQQALEGEAPSFQNNFYNFSEDLCKTETVKNTWKTKFPDFQIGGKLASKIKLQTSRAKNLEVAYAYGRAIVKLFQVVSPFPIATTFSNRTPENWDTVSMFANTLPLMFSEDLDLDRFFDNFYELMENSNISLDSVVKPGTLGNFADFALNFHKNLDDSQDLCQFPLLLTISEANHEAQLEFDETLISSNVVDSLKQEILKLLGLVEVRKKLELIIAAFKKFLDNTDVTKSTDFFQAGGHSLTAMRLIDHLSDLLEVEIPLKLIFEHRTPEALEKALTRSEVVEEREDERREELEKFKFKFPLSRQQLQMFYLSQMNENSLEYQLPFIQPFPHSLDPSKIHRSLLMTMQEQSVFRTVIRLDSETGEPFQEVLSLTEAFIQCQVDLVHSEPELHARIRLLCDEPINVLEGSPMIRASFISSPEKHVAFLHLHHLISDARSTQLTNSTMKQFSEDPERTPKRQKFSYMDYCRLDQTSETSEKGYLETLITGIDQWRLRGKSQMEKISVDIPKDLIARKLSSSSASSPFSIFLELISKALLSTQNLTNFNIAFPVINRTETTANLCGYFLNNLLINSSQLFHLPMVLTWNLPYSDVIKDVRHGSGKAPDVPVAEVYINCRYDLEFDETDDEVLLDLVPLKLHFPIEFDVDLLDTYRVTMRSDRFSVPEMQVILNIVLKGFNDTPCRRKHEKIFYGPRKDTPNLSIPSIYQQFFTANSTSIFATTSKTSTTYAQAYRRLSQYSSCLSKKFLTSKAQPIRSDDVISVAGTRSTETTMKCLAVQFTGAAYLPIDASYPEERKKTILKDSVFNFEYNGRVDQEPRHRHFAISTDYCLSYIITTSGTTGTPKSVAIGAKSLLNLFLSSTLTMKCSSSSRTYQFTNFVFDNSVLEVSMSIASQGTLVYGPLCFDPADFEKSIETEGITHCLLFPSLVQSFNISKIKNLAYWVVGGEPLPQSLLDSALALGIKVIQNYGPTETTAFAIAKHMKKGDAGCQIGLPAVNSKIRIVEGEDQGELLISGLGIMRGYLNRKESQWYASGDVCRIEKGVVEFVGRTDTQIKIRGYRVELTEIEKTIESRNGIASCKALFDKESQQIHVFYTGELEKLSSNDAREHCERYLEPHKIPSTFNGIDKFPLTGNSKIDTLKLMELVKNLPHPTLPNSLESDLSSIWTSLLNCPEPSPSDHFFLIGGHSLLLVRLRHLIETKLGISLKVPEILQNLKFSDMLELLAKKKQRAISVVVFPALYGGCLPYHKMVEELKKRFLGKTNFILLDEEFGDTVDEVAKLYRLQIEESAENIETSKLVFIGASSAGTFAFSTSQLFADDDVTVLLLDTGTFWSLIEKLEFRKHEQEIVENLKNFGVDQKTSKCLAETSWKTLQILKNYHPEESRSNVQLHVLSVDGSDLGWSKYSKNLIAHKIQGDHYSMLQDSEHVLGLVGKIEMVLKSIK